MFVLTVDQVGSRSLGDRVGEVVDTLRRVPTVLPFERTVGDELQGLLDTPLSVVDAIVLLMRQQQWHIGLGIGPVDQPLPAQSREARGAAFLAARAAVDRAKQEPSHVCVVAAAPAEVEGHDAEVLLHLVAALWERRTEEGWQAVDLMAAGLTQAVAAAHLGISRQAVSQRLQAAAWTLDRESRPVLERMLRRADRVAAGGVG